MPVHEIRNKRTGEVISVEAPTREAALEMVRRGYRPPKEAAQAGAQGRAPETTEPPANRYGQAMLQSFASGASYDFADELRGLLEGGIAAAAPGGEGFRDAYTRARDSQRELQAGLRSQHPAVSGAAQFAGGVTAPMPGMGWARAAPSALSTMARLGAQGAVAGSAQAVGAAEDVTAGGVARGALLGAAAPVALAGAGSLTGILGGAAWRSMTQSARQRAEQIIRDRAMMSGISADDIIRELDVNPNFTLADVDAVFTRLAAGTALREPTAERVAREALDARQSGAAGRITQALDRARPGATLGRPRSADVGRAADAAARELGPEYQSLSRASLEVTPRLQDVMDTMPSEYNAALANWQRRTVQPGVDPLRQGGVLPGDIIQDMKATADRTVGRWDTAPADAAAAQSVRRAMLEEVDPLLPSTAAGRTYPELRDEYARRVLQPREGLETGSRLFRGGDEAMERSRATIERMSPTGRRAMRAGAVDRAIREVNTYPGTGDQFFGAPLMRRGDLSDERLAIALGSNRKAQRIDSLLEQERRMHQTRATVLPHLGSQTAYRQQAGMDAGQAMEAASVVGQAKTGSWPAAVTRTMSLLRGESPEVSRQIMTVLVQRGASQADIRSLMAGRPTKNASDMVMDAAPIIARLGRGVTASRDLGDGNKKAGDGNKKARRAYLME